MTENLTKVVDRMVAIKAEQAALKTEYSGLEGELLMVSTEDLKNTKLKSVTYLGTDGAKATATMADSLKVIYPAFLKKIFGVAYADVATEKVDVKLSDPAKRMLSAIWKSDYTRDSFGDILLQLPVDDATRKVLAKKLRGANFSTDKKTLMDIGKLDEETADQYAFFLTESIAWESFYRLLSVNGEPSEADISAALSWVNSAVIVEETPKITVEAAN